LRECRALASYFRVLTTMSCEKFAVRVPAWVWKEVYYTSLPAKWKDERYR